MLREETVEKGTLDLIRRLMADEKLSDFNLVGGTALALKIGHRKSVDIDLFTTKDFNSEAISHHLKSTYNTESIQTTKNGVFGFVNDVKVDLVGHKYPLVKEVEIVGDIRLISLQDIGAMKLNAIHGNGSRLKDFVDIYALLEHMPLQKIMEACGKKYPDMNTLTLKNSLVYFKDIDFGYPVNFIGRGIKWHEIENRLKSAVNNPGQTFSRQIKSELLAKRTRKDKVKKKGLGF